MKNNITSSEYLDLNRLYDVVLPLEDSTEEAMYDYNYCDREHNIKSGFITMSFHEDDFCILEEYLFNFIGAECDLIITMYEEEFADVEHLPKILETTQRQIKNSDNKRFLELAKEFLAIIEKAIEIRRPIGFFF